MPAGPESSGYFEPRGGVQIGHISLIDRLASGGKGEVWVARDESLSRTVAVKLLLVNSQRDRQRLLVEAQAAAALDHPHIAKIFDYGDDPPHIAMQYIAGHPIDQAPADRIRCLRDAARALHYAHEHGVLHRDVKPGNILVDHSGKAYVVDFGLARLDPALLGEDKKALTISGEILGTPAYMSPEQARGRSVDARTDVYGLGATLYTLLSGKLPFDGATAYDILEGVVQDEPDPLSGDSDQDLQTIVRTAMHKDPIKRYATAEDFADDIDRWLKRLPISAKRHQWGYRLRRSVQRQPGLWLMMVALIITLTLLLNQFLSATNRIADLADVRAASQTMERDYIELQATQDRLATAYSGLQIDVRLWSSMENIAQRFRRDARRIMPSDQRVALLTEMKQFEQQWSSYDEAIFVMLAAESAWLRRDAAVAVPLLAEIQAQAASANGVSGALSSRLNIIEQVGRQVQLWHWWQQQLPQVLAQFVTLPEALDWSPEASVAKQTMQLANVGRETHAEPFAESFAELFASLATSEDQQIGHDWWQAAAQRDWIGILSGCQQWLAAGRGPDTWRMWWLASLAAYQKDDLALAQFYAEQAWLWDPYDPYMALWLQHLEMDQAVKKVMMK